MSTIAIIKALNIPADVLTQPQWATLIVLADHAANHDGTGCYPSVPTIASEARMSVRRARAALTELKASGFIHFPEERKGGRCITTQYTLLVETWPQKAARYAGFDGENPAPNDTETRHELHENPARRAAEPVREPVRENQVSIYADASLCSDGNNAQEGDAPDDEALTGTILPPDDDDGCDTFIAVYPHRPEGPNVPNIRAAWQRAIVKPGHTPERIIDAARRQRQAPVAERYRLSAERWLREERYLVPYITWQEQMFGGPDPEPAVAPIAELNPEELQAIRDYERMPMRDRARLREQEALEDDDPPLPEPPPEPPVPPQSSSGSAQPQQPSPPPAPVTSELVFRGVSAIGHAGQIRPKAPVNFARVTLPEPQTVEQRDAQTALAALAERRYGRRTFTPTPMVGGIQ
jgi:hypothetical protein